MRNQTKARVDVAGPIMSRGETGTGRHLIVRDIHDLGPHADQPFVVRDR